RPLPRGASGRPRAASECVNKQGPGPIGPGPSCALPGVVYWLGTGAEPPDAGAGAEPPESGAVPGPPDGAGGGGGGCGSETGTIGGGGGANTGGCTPTL